MFTVFNCAYFSAYKIQTFFFENQMPKNLLFSFRYKTLTYNNLQYSLVDHQFAQV